MTDIEIKRDKKGSIKVNVSHSVVHHSPSGFEVGYAGSGPADLALNILQHFIPGEQVECHEGKCSRHAMMLHQTFKREFITPMGSAGGTIKEDIIKQWIKKEVTKLNNEV